MGKAERLQHIRTSLESLFPGLKTSNYSVTSDAERRYNCIAWAAGDSTRWWEPARYAYWPVGVRREYTVDAYREAFESLGYRETDSTTLEPGAEKVALFARIDGYPLHAARQLADGRWTSKLGQLEDITHELFSVQGSGNIDLFRMADYGRVTLVMMRTLPVE